jgi:hypothetical protein
MCGSYTLLTGDPLPRVTIDLRKSIDCVSIEDRSQDIHLSRKYRIAFYFLATFPAACLFGERDRRVLVRVFYICQTTL